MGLRRWSSLLVVGFLGLAAFVPVSVAQRKQPPGIPDPPREFRGVWIATVDNIDWPSRPGLPAEQQQAELVALFDRAVALRLNAVILQVRPSADALYASPYEPWSEYLTGQMGRPPAPYYDPLAFAVDEAHRRGLELHAWFNPFRAHHPSATGPLSDDHVSKAHPELVRTYGRYLWLDPGEPDVQELAHRVILDVVRRYDVDGIHLDDYFYPYQERDSKNRLLPFPDDATWARAVQGGAGGRRDDWRRQNVDRFVERLYREVKREKPWVKVGISPFGIWRPGHPPQIKGLDAFAELYADARKWLQNGWLDYCSPQLYWKIDQAAQSYPVLLQWWVEQNRAGRHLWPGNYANKVEAAAWDAGEILEQVRLTRAQAGATGNIYFSMHALTEDRHALGERLAAELYDVPALVPASPWLGDRVPAAPVLSLEVVAQQARVMLATPRGEAPWLWVVRARYGPAWTMEIVPGSMRMYALGASGDALPDEVAVSIVDRVGNEGPVAAIASPRGEGSRLRTF